jgi:hypothetical protein
MENPHQTANTSVCTIAAWVKTVIDGLVDVFAMVTPSELKQSMI